MGEALAARLMGATEAWGHEPFFDYVDRWVREGADGSWSKDKNTATGYSVFPGKFIAAMWETYRDKADAIGTEVTRKRTAGRPAATD